MAFVTMETQSVAGEGLFDDSNNGAFLYGRLAGDDKHVAEIMRPPGPYTVESWR